MKAILIIILTALSLSQSGCKNNSTGPSDDLSNLIKNSTFETNGQHTYDGWTLSDTNLVSFSDDVPSLGGNWSLQMSPISNFIPTARTYVTGESGRHVYRLTLWSRATSDQLVASARVGVLQPGGTLANSRSVSISSMGWQYYTVEDTLDLVRTDSLTVELSPGAMPVIPSTALFDLIRLERTF